MKKTEIYSAIHVELSERPLILVDGNRASIEFSAAGGRVTLASDPDTLAEVLLSVVERIRA